MTEPESTSGGLAAAHRWIAILVLGFASGLPLALTGLAMQAWLTMDGLLGRRRGWVVFTQALLALALFALADISPKYALPLFAALGVGVAFISASQDIVVDAYRVDLLPARERGIGASLFVMGYRIAMILSGGVALIWTDAVDGIGMTWPAVYRLMA
ncbi:MAG: MFS transporter, partial [Burkholderiales bacterium]|nr:MFS transporter [Burkholderiales bacterium]